MIHFANCSFVTPEGVVVLTVLGVRVTDGGKHLVPRCGTFPGSYFQKSPKNMEKILEAQMFLSLVQKEDAKSKPHTFPRWIGFLTEHIHCSDFFRNMKRSDSGKPSNSHCDWEDIAGPCDGHACAEHHLLAVAVQHAVVRVPGHGQSERDVYFFMGFPA
ncbi:hypothetical protein XENOCAPTIV_016108 [Xenoophorus captivus]|uniref:Uncharacterized protein n=1 Tax=Xenoophorus captivus TaxID=1517983 RepID=A0ABV0Q595_9TELE